MSVITFATKFIDEPNGKYVLIGNSKGFFNNISCCVLNVLHKILILATWKV